MNSALKAQIETIRPPSTKKLLILAPKRGTMLTPCLLLQQAAGARLSMTTKPTCMMSSPSEQVIYHIVWVILCGWIAEDFPIIIIVTCCLRPSSTVQLHVLSFQTKQFLKVLGVLLYMNYVSKLPNHCQLVYNVWGLVEHMKKLKFFGVSTYKASMFDWKCLSVLDTASMK